MWWQCKIGHPIQECRYHGIAGKVLSKPDVMRGRQRSNEENGSGDECMKALWSGIKARASGLAPSLSDSVFLDIGVALLPGLVMCVSPAPLGGSIALCVVPWWCEPPLAKSTDGDVLLPRAGQHPNYLYLRTTPFLFARTGNLSSPINSTSIVAVSQGSQDGGQDTDS